MGRVFGVGWVWVWVGGGLGGRGAKPVALWLVHALEYAEGGITCWSEASGGKVGGGVGAGVTLLEGGCI